MYIAYAAGLCVQCSYYINILGICREVVCINKRFNNARNSGQRNRILGRHIVALLNVDINSKLHTLLFDIGYGT